MRFFYVLCLVILLPTFGYADAGFSIGRPKAPCYAVFTGIDKLGDFEFFKVTLREDGYNSDMVLDSSSQLKNNDTVRIFYAEGSRRWQGPVKILVRNKATQQFVDSLTLIAEGDNLVINFTAAGNNKVKYAIDKTKAVYPYQLFAGDNTDDASVAKRNKFILISLSVIGFLVLGFMLYKRRNTQIPLKDP